MKLLVFVLSFGVSLSFESVAAADWLCEEDLSHLVKPPGSKVRGQVYSIVFKGSPVCDWSGVALRQEVVCHQLADVEHTYYRLHQTYHDVPVVIQTITRDTRAGRIDSEYTDVDLTKAFGVKANIYISRKFRGEDYPRPKPIYVTDGYLEEQSGEEQGQDGQATRVKLLCQRF